ncbi:addiction module toxin, RelE/StbE family [Xaviernesmea oryzae]|uniref:Addiction module toxin, RelE/StbE family n=1 Tax=Xaviernesmea oryzae TaxID=464029 RepID=A0A1X7CWF5_9HYPH|nr:type II toxin-antitoxin system mRNA interferase toxin, RelE/StbE family [Xaviernesmea oryzae]SMF04412.1 addiction module toxin, RelE/StbE family [Xaviernesmea oryzae]
MKIIWSRRALHDRDRIYSYIEEDDPSAALALDDFFENRSTQLAAHPMLGRVGRVDGTRELVVHPNYILIYDIADASVRILRVLHAARQWPPTR